MTLQESDPVTHSGEPEAVAVGAQEGRLPSLSWVRLLVAGHGTGVVAGPGY